MITGMRLGIIRGINNWYGSGAASVLSTPATEGWLAFNSASIRKNSLRWLRGLISNNGNVLSLLSDTREIKPNKHRYDNGKMNTQSLNYKVQSMQHQIVYCQTMSILNLFFFQIVSLSKLEVHV